MTNVDVLGKRIVEMLDGEKIDDSLQALAAVFAFLSLDERLTDGQRRGMRAYINDLLEFGETLPAMQIADTRH